MKEKNNSTEKNEGWVSSALKVNLERTSVAITIPPQYEPLLKAVEDHYGLQRKARELLTELNHPFVNWEHVLTELKSLSIGDFYEFNHHKDGLSALSILLTIYLDVIKFSSSETIKDSAIHYLFDYIDTILSRSKENLPRNLSLFAEIIDALAYLSDKDAAIFRKCSAYLKKNIKLVFENNADILADNFERLLYKMFKITYQFWLTQPDPSCWLTKDEVETQEAIDAYRQIIQPLSHQHLRTLLEKLEVLSPNRQQRSEEQVKAYLDMPDYFQIVNGYFLIADELEKSPSYQGRQYLMKLDFLFSIMSVSGLSDINTNALGEIN